MPVSKTTASVTAIIAFLVGASVALVLLQRFGVFEPIPYRVLKETVTWEKTNSGVIYRAQFLKDACRYDRLIVRGVYFDQVDPRPIPWRSIAGDQGDREAGQQGLEIAIGPLAQEYEALEIRTRHICDGKPVDRLFDRIDLE
jgi:hypothetical protein